MACGDGAGLVVACLHRVLARSAGARGTPPESVVSRCVALISPADAARLSLHVTQEVFISRGDCRTVVCVWPSSRVEPGYVALDDATLHALGIAPGTPVARMAPPTPRGTPAQPGSARSSGKKGSSSKKKKKRAQHARHSTPSPAPRARPARRRDGDDDDDRAALPAPPTTPPPPPRPPPATVALAPICAPVPPARAVQLRAELGVSGGEIPALAKRALQGRAVVPGAPVAATVLGAPRVLRVCGVDGGGATAGAGAVRVGADTVVTFARAAGPGGGPGGGSGGAAAAERTLAQLGGLDGPAAELLALARGALRGGGERSGALLHGPAGTGKSALARAVARELRAHAVAVHGAAVYADGAGAGGVAGLEAAFARAAASPPAVLILDDLDAFARARGAFAAAGADGLGGGGGVGGDDDGVDGGASAVAELPNLAHDLARLLDARPPGVFVVATSARPARVDPALRRPRRLGADIALEVPDARARAAILRALSARARAAGSVAAAPAEVDALARAAYGCVGADLAGAWARAVAGAVRRGAGEAAGAAGAAVSAADLRAALRATTPSALREVAVEVPTTRWGDIGGQHGAKTRLREAVELPLSDAGRAALDALGLDPPRGILLYGPPGCAKTLLARAVATESHANFLSVRGPELLSKWVGASERAVRDVFRRARAAAPAVVFFDEVDALAGSRDGHAGASAHSRVVAQLLSEMDGVAENVGAHGERVVVIAATNRPDLLDSALLRPGRIDVQIYVGLPDEEERRAVLHVHTRKTPLADDVAVEEMALDHWTGGMSGAEIAALVREAALAAMEDDPEGADVVRMEHFQRARRRVSRRTSPEMVSFFERYREVVEHRTIC